LGQIAFTDGASFGADQNHQGVEDLRRKIDRMPVAQQSPFGRDQLKLAKSIAVRLTIHGKFSKSPQFHHPFSWDGADHSRTLLVSGDYTPRAEGNCLMPKVVAVACLWFAVSLHADIDGVTSSNLFVSSSQANPNFIVTGPDGNVWFTDEAHQAVGKLAISGSNVSATTFPLASSLPAGQVNIDFVRGITVGPDNAIWFAFRACM